MKGLLAVAAASVVLVGCAGSANHEVVSSHSAADQGLSCGQIDAEKVRVQAVIDGVNKDKEDVSGKDVLDGVLWFPFNLIAKNSNYNNALEAADARLATMSDLKKEKGCGSADESEQLADTTQKLRDLNQLYKDGVLTEDEYLTSKEKVLASLGE